MLSSPELEASLGMERGLSHVGLTVLTGESCSYIGGWGGGGVEKRRTQIKNMPYESCSLYW